jgi:hypothetical protein
VINPDAVRLVRWWEDARFEDADQLHAAELIAFDVLDPALRSRGLPRKNALQYIDDPGFRGDMESLFRVAPSGDFHLPWLWDVDARVEDIERRLIAIENRLDAAG